MIINLPVSHIMPGIESVLEMQGIPNTAKISSKVQTILDKSIEMVFDNANPIGIFSEISLEEFLKVFIGEGKTTTEISEKLNLSTNTISTYRTRILEKMNMNSNAALIHYVIKNNLLS